MADTGKDADLVRYTRGRLARLLRGGTRELYDEALDATCRLAYAERIQAIGDSFDIVATDPSDRIDEKIDLERALAGIGLAEPQRAMGALLAMGWSLGATARVLGAHPETVRRLLNGSGRQPGLAARLEAYLNGREEAP